jgi:ElaA protein
MPHIKRALFAELDPLTLYRILQLRSEVFVVEQECAYLDLDGSDTDPTTVHWWAETDDGPTVIAGLRVLQRDESSEIGRVVTSPTHRRHGVGRLLLARALDDCGRPVTIKAQSRVVPWYATFGFAPSGAEYDEDGIPHTPMRLR